MIFKIERARFAQAMFPYLMDLVHHGVRITPAEHPPFRKPGTRRGLSEQFGCAAVCWNMLEHVGSENFDCRRLGRPEMVRLRRIG